MDIKEIALRLLAEEFPGMHQENQAFMVEFAEALIESYKAELLKEVGEPVAYQVGNSYPRLDGTLAKIVGIGNQTVVDDEGCHYYNRAQYRGRVRGTAHDYSYPRNLVRYYTSDQVVAAIAKATKPLEEEIERLEAESEEYAQLQSRCFDGGGSHASVFDEVAELRAQLAAAQEEIAAINRDKKALTNRAFDLGCQLETVKSQVADACAACVADQDDVPLGVVGVLRQGLWREYMPETTLDECEEQLAKAEQRVAEACAYLAHQHMDADIAADAINNGEWRKFVKEV